VSRDLKPLHYTGLVKLTAGDQLAEVMARDIQ
jgi:hypothetical protein